MLKICISIRKLPLLFLISLSILTAIAGVITVLRSFFSYGNRFLPIFDLGVDSSIPTWYASFSLLCCSILCALIAVKTNRDQEKFFWHWTVLSLVFCLMSIDEVARIHETLGGWVGDRLPTTKQGVFYYSWVIFAIPLVAVFLLSYVKFTMQLPRRAKQLFILALLTYIGGGLGVEMLGANYHSSNDIGSLTYSLLVLAEEFLEMLGAFLFICAFTAYIRQSFKGVQILIE